MCGWYMGGQTDDGLMDECQDKCKGGKMNYKFADVCFYIMAVSVTIYFVIYCSALSLTLGCAYFYGCKCKKQLINKGNLDTECWILSGMDGHHCGSVVNTVASQYEWPGFKPQIFVGVFLVLCFFLCVYGFLTHALVSSHQQKQGLILLSVLLIPGNKKWSWFPST